MPLRELSRENAPPHGEVEEEATRRPGKGVGITINNNINRNNPRACHLDSEEILPKEPKREALWAANRDRFVTFVDCRDT